MVLYHEDGQVVIVPDFVDKISQVLGFLWIHAGRRFIQKEQAGTGGQGSGNLQTALESVGQGGGYIVL